MVLESNIFISFVTLFLFPVDPIQIHYSMELIRDHDGIISIL